MKQGLSVTQARLEHLGLIATHTLECWDHRHTPGPNLLKHNLDVTKTFHFLSFLVGQRSTVRCSVWLFLWTLGDEAIPPWGIPNYHGDNATMLAFALMKMQWFSQWELIVWDTLMVTSIHVVW